MDNVPEEQKLPTTYKPMPKPDRIIWGWPDKVEMTDQKGEVHTYSIIEILDGLTAIAKGLKDDAS